MTYQVGMSMNDVSYALSSKCFLAETTLDVVEHLSVHCLCLIQYILELKVR